jgi:hypothetical protein
MFIKMGFQHWKADLCVFFKMAPKGLIMWVIMVDDCTGCGQPEDFL